MKRYVLCLILALLTVTDGCSCGSKGDNPVTSTIPPEVKVVLSGSPVHPDYFVVKVEVSDIVNAVGIYFRLNYDPKIIQLKTKDNPAKSVEVDDFFKQGDANTLLVANFLNQDADSGCLIVGLARASGKLGIIGTGTILTFKFTTVSNGTSAVKFSETAKDNLLFALGLEDIFRVKWTNAEITVK